ncbi:hypothetical protein B0T09DRAFT_347045 [Sordaria sp. MPI-SDFR-AT-0083]|nr:hypothetical protein B0T09DRAFT_347045 [Sordaria sp. MPI-SDFR-AT-0083]
MPFPSLFIIVSIPAQIRTCSGFTSATDQLSHCTLHSCRVLYTYPPCPRGYSRWSWWAKLGRVSEVVDLRQHVSHGTLTAAK